MAEMLTPCLIDWLSVVDNAASKTSESLRRQGWAVLDHALGEHATGLLRDEVKNLADMKEGFVQHTFHFGASTKRVVARKPGIFEADLDDTRLATHLSSGCLQSFCQLFKSGAFARSFAREMPHLGLVESANGTAIKIQYNDGKGGCFPFHFDNPGSPNRRALTAIIYLNTDWQPAHGGQLELQPFLGRRIVIPPVFGRMCVFYSDRVLHCVRPARAPRFCFTVWIDSDMINRPEDTILKGKHIAIMDTSGSSESDEDEIYSPKYTPMRAANFFRNSPLQRVVSRAIYDDEYKTSLRDMVAACCRDAGNEDSSSELKDQRIGKAMLAEHTAHITHLLRNEAMAKFVKAMKEIKAQVPLEPKFVDGPLSEGMAGGTKL